MKCRACGYLSLEPLERCKRCGALLAGASATAGAAVVMPIQDPTRESVEALVAEVDLDDARLPNASSPPEEEAPAFAALEDEIALPDLPPEEEAPDGMEPLSLGIGGGDEPLAARNRERGQAAGLRPGQGGGKGDAGPIIDRDDEVPDRFWALEGAPLGSRIAALALDHALLTAVLGIFFGGALVALRIAGLDSALLLDPVGLKAAAVPFAGLGLLLSLGYFTFFHGWAGRTPGKRVAGIAVRMRDGSPLTFGRALARWLAAVIAVAPIGVGIAWALFEPRRLGWADLLSGTFVGASRRSSSAG